MYKLSTDCLEEPNRHGQSVKRPQWALEIVSKAPTIVTVPGGGLAVCAVMANRWDLDASWKRWAIGTAGFELRSGCLEARTGFQGG